jgi:uncharacterized protein (TIGR02186 family)
MTENRKQNAEYRKRRSRVVQIPFALCFMLFAFTGQAFAELTVDANHSHVKIDFFYHGSTMSIRGTSDPGVDLIIKLASPDGHEALKQKGKVAGVLWMNVGTLKIENAPRVYFLHSTKKVEDILSREEMERYVIGYPALAKHIEMNPIANDEEKDRWFKEFVRFKENSRLYSISIGKISLTEKDGKRNYYILTEWPYQVPPGIYTVTVFAVKDRRVVETAQTSITVEQVGVVKTLANMAKNNGILYGIISIVAALGAGFGVGLIFRKGGGAH